jgi:hypothetical protein
VNAPRANGEPSVFVLQGTARRGVDSQNWPHWALEFPLTHILSLKLLINFVFSDTTSETTKRKYIANCTKKIKQKFIMGDSRTPRDSILPRKESRP